VCCKKFGYLKNKGISLWRISQTPDFCKLCHGTSIVVKCCRQLTDDHRLLITLSVQLSVSYDGSNLLLYDQLRNVEQTETTEFEQMGDWADTARRADPSASAEACLTTLFASAQFVTSVNLAVA